MLVFSSTAFVSNIYFKTNFNFNNFCEFCIIFLYYMLVNKSNKTTLTYIIMKVFLINVKFVTFFINYVPFFL